MLALLPFVLWDMIAHARMARRHTARRRLLNRVIGEWRGRLQPGLPVGIA